MITAKLKPSDQRMLIPLIRLGMYGDKLFSEEGQKTERNMKSKKKCPPGIWNLRCSRSFIGRLD